MENKKYWIWLSRLENVSTSSKNKLIEKYKTPINIFNLTKQQLRRENIITENEIKSVLNLKYKENLEQYQEYMELNKIDIISILEKEYPEKLRNIYDKPVVIFIKGNKKILNEKSIAVVGSRQASHYGKLISENMSYNLSINNINVISGLAIGVDSYAHIGALKKLNIKQPQLRGKAIAVIGNGIDRIYPEENRELAEQIVKSGGVIISEYIVGRKPERKNFPERNRIISGLSDGVLVVEAKERSGALITAEFAMNQGKEVYAIPGNINNINSIGTNQLLKDGANFVTNINDILYNMQVS